MSCMPLKLAELIDFGVRQSQIIQQFQSIKIILFFYGTLSMFQNVPEKKRKFIILSALIKCQFTPFHTRKLKTFSNIL